MNEVTKITASVFGVIFLVVILARADSFNKIINQSGETATGFMKAAAGEK